jgi:hypothetical protein
MRMGANPGAGAGSGQFIDQQGDLADVMFVAQPAHKMKGIFIERALAGRIGGHQCDMHPLASFGASGRKRPGACRPASNR